jgi:Abortive infection alpha
MAETDDGIVPQTIGAVAELAKAVPVYQDALQPAAKEVGKTLELGGKTINAILKPLAGTVWGWEKICDWVVEQVNSRLKDTPPEDLQTPKPHIAVPAIEALRYTGSEPELSDLFANLLATSMDRKTAVTAHPSFVESIKNMSSDEAKIMRLLSKDRHRNYAIVDMIVEKSRNHQLMGHRCLTLVGIQAGVDHKSLTTNYIDNLGRLGLIEIRPEPLVEKDPYEELQNHPQILLYKEAYESSNPGSKVRYIKKRFGLTTYGWQFVQACVLNKADQSRG